MEVFNFGAGPSKLPEEVIADVQQEFVKYGTTGISIVEMSHRSKEYANINNEAISLLRKLLDIPDNYKVLFMQGGGTGMFAAVAMNLIGKTGKADYIVTGSWSSKAAKEAAKYGEINIVTPSTDEYIDIPPQDTWKLDPNASYVYYCSNETIHGVEFPFVPDTKGVPLVCDMSSNFLSRTVDVKKFGVIFAGAQKNIGPAGIAVVIVREDLLGAALPITPSIMDFAITAKDNSIHNTPPTFVVYVVGKVFKWIKKSGGVKMMEDNSKAKSNLIYDVINSSEGFYACPVRKQCRSRMNIPFRLPSEKLEQKFLQGAENLNMIQLKGHRSVGGIRVSLYNAVCMYYTKTLAMYMLRFMSENK